jgi:hypothetical protein
MQPTDATKAIISGTVRTLAQLVPVAGGAVAQAWSEYESFRQNKRIEDFFSELRIQLESLEASHADLKGKIASMPDVAELLERTVALAKRETSEAKRQSFSRLYSSFLAAPDKTNPDERIDLIHHVEQLTEADLRLLAEFSKHGGTLRGDIITNTVSPGWTAIGQKQPDASWLQDHGHVVHSISKLEARGLIRQASFNAGFQSSGEPGSSFNMFRRKAWHIAPIGVKLLKGLGR